MTLRYDHDWPETVTFYGKPKALSELRTLADQEKRPVEQLLLDAATAYVAKHTKPVAPVAEISATKVDQPVRKSAYDPTGLKATLYDPASGTGIPSPGISVFQPRS